MHETRTEDDEALLGRVRDALDTSVAQLDAAARERLLLARRRALAAEPPPRQPRRWPLVAAAASLAVLVLAVSVAVQRPGEAPAGGSTLALAEDPAVLEWLLGEAAADPVGDADFYAWLDEAERPAAGGAGDAG